MYRHAATPRPGRCLKVSTRTWHSLSLQPAFPSLLFGPKMGGKGPHHKAPVSINGKREVCVLGKQLELFMVWLLVVEKACG